MSSDTLGSHGLCPELQCKRKGILMIKILKYSEIDDSAIFNRSLASSDVAETVSEIIADVRKRKDAALRDYSLRFDKSELDSLEVTREEIQVAVDSTDPELIDIMKESSENIRHFHEKQVRSDFVITDKPGIVLGQRIIPMERVGLYVPGGSASYPSSVLMNCIPAKIAGVKEIIITTPSHGGYVNPVILAAAEIAGADKIFKVGGAQAVAALAYGTESIPKVDKIVGPGNAYVAEAKKQVFGEVAIDMIAGPSEILIVADSSCDPAVLAADMLSQAEHDRMASAVMVTDSEILARKTAEQLERLIPLLNRADIARASVDNNGKIIITSSLSEAIEVSNRIAPEHLEICTDNPFDYLSKVRHAGSVFLGKNSPEALGDYFAGPNHTLPTSGTARFSSPLSVDDFIKKTSFTYYTAEALNGAAEKIAQFAMAEGLDAHAKSVLSRAK